VAGAALRSGRDRPAAAPVDAAATAPSEQEQVERNRICGKQCNAMYDKSAHEPLPTRITFLSLSLLRPWERANWGVGVRSNRECEFVQS
jgi:hypothetical protein